MNRMTNSKKMIMIKGNSEIVIHILKLLFFRSTKYNKSPIRNEIQRNQFMTNTFVFTLLIRIK